MRSVGREHPRERIHHLAVAHVALAGFVDQHHHLRDGRVEVERPRIVGDLLDRLVEQLFQLGRQRLVAEGLGADLPDFLEEAVHALQAVFLHVQYKAPSLPRHDASDHIL